jgi:hypothetical protein
MDRLLECCGNVILFWLAYHGIVAVFFLYLDFRTLRDHCRAGRATLRIMSNILNSAVGGITVKLPESGSWTHWTEFEPELDQGSVHCRSGSRRFSRGQVHGSEPLSILWTEVEPVRTWTRPNWYGEVNGKFTHICWPMHPLQDWTLINYY